MRRDFNPMHEQMKRVLIAHWPAGNGDDFLVFFIGTFERRQGNGSCGIVRPLVRRSSARWSMSL
jgi:hypothetical protein